MKQNIGCNVVFIDVDVIYLVTWFFVLMFWDGHCYHVHVDLGLCGEFGSREISGMYHVCTSWACVVCWKKAVGASKSYIPHCWTVWAWKG